MRDGIEAAGVEFISGSGPGQAEIASLTAARTAPEALPGLLNRPTLKRRPA